jgi:hypothetical protein
MENGSKRKRDHNMYSRSVLSLLATVVLLPSFAHAQSVQAGTLLKVRLEHPLTTETANQGQRVSAVFSEAVRVGSDIVVPDGTRLTGRVDFVQRRSRERHGWMRLVFTDLNTSSGVSRPLQASNTFRKNVRHPFWRYFIPIGTGVSLGVMFGGSARTSAIIGGALGGMVFATNVNVGGRHLKLSAGQSIDVRLNQDLNAVQ